MTRISKQQERRHQYPHRCKDPSVKTGSKKDNLPLGYKEHANSMGDCNTVFIPKIK